MVARSVPVESAVVHRFRRYTGAVYRSTSGAAACGAAASDDVGDELHAGFGERFGHQSSLQLRTGLCASAQQSAEVVLHAVLVL
jgi:hypothetical protein